MADNYRGPASNYPAGFNNVTLRGVPITQSHPGQVFWVGNSATSVLPGHVGASDNNPGTFAAPFSTISYAVNTAATASRGDIVFVKPGHAETITTATDMVLATAGVAVIGLGSGSMRPTITVSTANTATLAVTAANIALQNILFLSTRATVTSAITVTGTALAPGLIVDNCEFRDTSATLVFSAAVTTNATANNADGLTFTNNKIVSAGVATATKTALNLVADSDRMVVTDNSGASLQTTVAMLATTAATSHTNCYIARNRFSGAHTSTSLACGISGTGTAWSGVAENNYFFTLAASTGIWIPVTTKLALFQNYSPIAGAYATQGTLNPVAT